ncbi:MAG: hypothetical protein HC886_22030 [Leptolyngbyaceae cyanobacterium SM1_1_3]|nr:hypothetical protein [Leptolyngbyaceae cyanobacterium SM1_1_3]NJN03738.1 hypothetical protein [Leptolyngbyaceae cyanobacterium RM1_1_2]NJO08543.1 hypothetical protein [Leptolyngbyaceae cyanobacterium SL_1_1]
MKAGSLCDDPTLDTNYFTNPLKAILKSHLDEVPVVTEEPESPAIDHDNLRGQHYYS